MVVCIRRGVPWHGWGAGHGVAKTLPKRGVAQCVRAQSLACDGVGSRLLGAVGQLDGGGDGDVIVDFGLNVGVIDVVVGSDLKDARYQDVVNPAGSSPWACPCVWWARRKVGSESGVGEGELVDELLEELLGLLVVLGGCGRRWGQCWRR